MGLFVLAVCAGALFLFLPGYLILRGVSFSGPVAFVCAPLVTIPIYSILCICFAKAHIFCSWYALFVPTFVVGCVMALVHFVHGRKKGVVCSGDVFSDNPSRQPLASSKFVWIQSDWAIVALYVIIGLMISSACFAFFLDSPDSFVQEYDNAHHLGIIFGFVESGNWSPFSASLYISAIDAPINPLPGSGFYPTVWHTLCAMLVSLLGVSTAFAINAVNYLFVSIVFCSSMAMLMRALFPKEIGPVFLGSLCVLGFSAFPWMLIDFGPLYPNMSAFCMMPAFCFVFIRIFSNKLSARRRLVWIIMLIFGLIACAFTQPNAAFTAAVFLAPFCVYKAAQAADLLHVPSGKKCAMRFVFGAVATLLVVVIWMLLYNAPFMQSVVMHSWAVSTPRIRGILNVLALCFNASGIQLILSILVVVGGIRTLVNREHLWLLASYVIASIIYVASVTSDGSIQHILSGFWYTDSFRTAAFSALFAIPLAALGMWTVAQGCASIARHLRPSVSKNGTLVTSACVIAVVVLISNYCLEPIFISQSLYKSPFEAVLSELQIKNEPDAPLVYSDDEKEFVEQVKEVVDPDDLIINVPDDGSVFSYGADGVRVYYRYLRTYGGPDETDDSKIIRNHLVDIASDSSVQHAVSDVNAKYLLVLDQGEAKGSTPHLFTYENGKNWKGIESISDETPGFEVVLSRDDMRLYRIVA